MLTLLFSLGDCIRARAALQAEIIALRHQLLILQRSNRGHKLRLSRVDRILWVWLSQLWTGWRTALAIVKPETVIGWHRRGFRLYWCPWRITKFMQPSVFGIGLGNASAIDNL